MENLELFDLEYKFSIEAKGLKIHFYDNQNILCKLSFSIRNEKFRIGTLNQVISFTAEAGNYNGRHKYGVNFTVKESLIKLVQNYKAVL